MVPNDTTGQNGMADLQIKLHALWRQVPHPHGDILAFYPIHHLRLIEALLDLNIRVSRVHFLVRAAAGEQECEEGDEEEVEGEGSQAGVGEHWVGVRGASYGLKRWQYCL